MNRKTLEPIHPGEILQEEFLTPMNVSQSKLARAIGVPHRRINEIALGKRSITPDTAMRFSKYFGTTPEFWMNLQTTYDLRTFSENVLILFIQVKAIRWGNQKLIENFGRR